MCSGTVLELGAQSLGGTESNRGQKRSLGVCESTCLICKKGLSKLNRSRKVSSGCLYLSIVGSQTHNRDKSPQQKWQARKSWGSGCLDSLTIPSVLAAIVGWRSPSITTFFFRHSSPAHCSTWWENTGLGAPCARGML